MSSSECEMCGNKIRGKPIIIFVEGAEMRVCPQCSKYGTEIKKPQSSPPSKTSAGRAPSSPGAPPRPRRGPRDVFDLMEGEIVEDYADRIRAAREEKGWSQKELAEAMKEKELLVKKIEKSDLIPEDAVRKKLEKILEISLLDTAASAEARAGGTKITPTLGDMVTLKRGKK